MITKFLRRISRRRISPIDKEINTIVRHRYNNYRGSYGTLGQTHAEIRSAIGDRQFLSYLKRMDSHQRNFARWISASKNLNNPPRKMPTTPKNLFDMNLLFVNGHAYALHPVDGTPVAMLNTATDTRIELQTIEIKGEPGHYALVPFNSIHANVLDKMVKACNGIKDNFANHAEREQFIDEAMRCAYLYQELEAWRDNFTKEL